MASTSYTYEQKAAILLETAKAYYNKGPVIQYDQYAMDRLVRVTPRNTRYAPPEMGNARHMLFLDCSTFSYAVYSARQILFHHLPPPATDRQTH